MTFYRLILKVPLLTVFAALTWFIPLPSATAAEVDPLSGQIFIHDPSTIMKDHGRFYVFGTRAGINVRSSGDLIHWQNEPSVFAQPAAWITNEVPAFRGTYWAPDLTYRNGKFYLYYSCSTWGKQVSAIGLATSPTLDHTATNYAWTDGGMVICSTNGGAFNTIDPCVMQDTDGKMWLCFGSYWKGIFLTELDPQTGLRRDPNLAPCQLAWNNRIEASCLMRHDNHYYLFVNWGQCCEGTNSTYEVRIGRGDKITGPYLDKTGSDLAVGGGSVFLSNEGRFIGPGHIGLLHARDQEWISYHTYDANFNGRSRLYIRELDWTPDGWPVAGKPIEAAK